MTVGWIGGSSGVNVSIDSGYGNSLKFNIFLNK